MAATWDLVSADAQDALTEFATDFEMAFETAVQENSGWAETAGLGLSRVTRNLKTKWPIPIHNAGYSELKGDPKFRSLAEKSFELVAGVYQDGIMEKASVIEAPDFIAWDGHAEVMAGEASCLPADLIATALESNAGAGPTCWTGVSFFNATHPVNPIAGGSTATFSNLTSSRPLTVANFATAKSEMREILGINGRNLGLVVTHLMVPNELAETAKDILERDLIIEAGSTTDATVRNRHMGTAKLIVAPQLTDANDWYVIAANKRGQYIWVVIKRTAMPENLILGKDSDLYKKQLKVAVNSVWEVNAGLGLPHAIHKYQG